MHQSRMFSSQFSYVATQNSGTSRTSPERTAASAGSASGFALTNHCCDRYGSTTVSHRWQWPTAWRCVLSPRRSPFSASAASTALRAAKRSIPANGPPLSLTAPASVKMLMRSSPWRSPVAKSLGSCAGVTLTAPVPNAGSTRMSSATIGSVRLTNGCTTRRPTRSR